ncbi:hypothetical protein F8M41_001888 [Gigaspora margarita]|uniref:Uncharacterized protein n=1 Tax=Gigaspora margarita TaxID=4874 RepID=A0A8H3XGQ1_GIGMA|nr:hypothetical protein F8M41_001888 [Gigaspora margarita]
MVENSRESSDIVALSSVASNERVDKSEFNLPSDISSNLAKSEYFDNSVNNLNDNNCDLHFDEDMNINEVVQSNETEKPKVKKRRQKNAVYSSKKGEKYGSRSLRSDSKSSDVNHDVDITKE